MYVVPSEFFDSLMKKSRITEDPLVQAQVQIEDEKEKILKSTVNSEQDLHKYIDATQKQMIYDEQRKKQLAAPISVSLVPQEEKITIPKKRGRPPKQIEALTYSEAPRHQSDLDQEEQEETKATAEIKQKPQRMSTRKQTKLNVRDNETSKQETEQPKKPSLLEDETFYEYEPEGKRQEEIEAALKVAKPSKKGLLGIF